jgi:hypothetical protein
MRVTVNIASIPSRVDLLINTINSVIDQCDQINIALNNYTHNPYKHPKVNAVFTKNVFGDAARFMFCEREKGYMLFLDDDLIVSDTYVADMINWIDEYGVVTHHGRSFISLPIESYYKSPALKHRCLDMETKLRKIQIAGTGVLGFHTDNLKVKLDWFKKKNLADIWFSVNCHKLDVPIYALPHSKDYFTYQYPEWAIYEEELKDDSFQTNLINNNYKDIFL